MADYDSPGPNIELSSLERWQALEARVHLLEKWKESLSQTLPGSEGAEASYTSGASPGSARELLPLREPNPEEANPLPIEAVVVCEDQPPDEGDPDRSSEFDTSLLDDRTDEVKLQENVWHAAFFVGHSRQRGCCGSVCLISVMILSLLVQSAFIFITQRSFIEPKFGEKKTNELTRWRMNTGHNVKYYDSMTETSLTERVCNQADLYQVEMSDSKHDLIEAINKYLEGYGTGEPSSNDVPTGGVLSIMAVVVWSLTVLADVLDALNVALGLWNVPRNHGRTVFHEGSDGSIRLQGISYGRLVYCYWLLFSRMVTAVTMWEYGCLYLINYSIEPADMMVNAVALSIVLDVPKAMYILVPLGTKNLLTHLEPMPRSEKKHQWRGLDLRVILLGLGLLACTILSISQLGQVLIDLREAKSALCGGQTNFVYGLDAFGDFYNTKVQPRNASEDARTKATDRFIDILMHPEKDEGKKAENGALGIVFVGKGVSAVAALPLLPPAALADEIQTGCEDMFEENAFFLKELSKHSKSTNGVEANSCTDLKPLCHQLNFPMVRAYCPVTCGCSTPGADLFITDASQGCPAKCQGSDAYRTALRELPCLEKSAEILQKDPVWIDIAKQFDDLMKDSFKDFPSYWNLYCTLNQSVPVADCETVFRERGCGIVTAWKKEFGFEVCEGAWFSSDGRISRNMAEWCPRECDCLNGDPVDELVARGCPGTCTKDGQASSNDVEPDEDSESVE